MSLTLPILAKTSTSAYDLIPSMTTTSSFIVFNERRQTSATAPGPYISRSSSITFAVFFSSGSRPRRPTSSLMTSPITIRLSPRDSSAFAAVDLPAPGIPVIATISIFAAARRRSAGYNNSTGAKPAGADAEETSRGPVPSLTAGKEERREGHARRECDSHSKRLTESRGKSAVPNLRASRWAESETAARRPSRKCVELNPKVPVSCATIRAGVPCVQAGSPNRRPRSHGGAVSPVLEYHVVVGSVTAVAVIRIHVVSRSVVGTGDRESV